MNLLIADAASADFIYIYREYPWQAIRDARLRFNGNMGETLQ